MSGEILVVTGTGTGVGKTIASAAIVAANLDRRRVAVIKPGQTGVIDGEPGDAQEVARLTGCTSVHEFVRYEPALAPQAAARTQGVRPAPLLSHADRIREIAEDADLVIVEGAGGLLVRYDDQDSTIGDLALALSAPIVVVAHPALGTLNHTELTLEAAGRRGLEVAGVILGSWDPEPDSASRSNLIDLPRIPGFSLAGVLPAGMAGLGRDDFAESAHRGLTPALGGQFDAADFIKTWKL